MLGAVLSVALVGGSAVFVASLSDNQGDAIVTSRDSASDVLITEGKAAAFSSQVADRDLKCDSGKREVTEYTSTGVAPSEQAAMRTRAPDDIARDYVESPSGTRERGRNGEVPNRVLIVYNKDTRSASTQARIEVATSDGAVKSVLLAEREEESQHWRVTQAVACSK